jgi:CO/xanthine dehydrogenase Mo-binding subunit
MLGREKESVHLYEGHVGGGFGIRGEIYPEDVLVCAAALKFKRPIKWIEDRREHLIAANHSREQYHRIRAAIDAQGHILGIEDEFFHDNGAYMRTHAATVPDLAAAMLPGPYRVPAYRAVGHIRLTNKTPCGTYRAPGRYESTFVRERLMDAIAAKIGVDTVEIRKLNLIRKSAMPYSLGLDTLGTKITYDSGDYPRLLDKALKAADWPGLQKQLLARRKNGEKVGVGVAMFVEKSGLGPYDTVRVEITPDGSVEVITGVASIGQGVETVIAQICADALGVDYGNIRVVHGQTDRIARGMGAFASRVTVMCGEATRLAATKLRAEILQAAAELMQTSADQLDVVNGEVVRTGGPGPSMPLAELARGLPNGLSAEDTFESAHMVYPYGVHVAAVRIDGDTAAVHIERYVIAYDVGKAVNPKLVEGQIAGGLAQGIGGALLEEFRYDENGEPLSVTFADYLMPTASEVPGVTVIVSEDAPSPLNPLGLKGAGEGGANPVGAVIASAIDDALQRPGTVTKLPVTPHWLKKVLQDTSNR